MLVEKSCKSSVFPPFSTCCSFIAINLRFSTSNDIKSNNYFFFSVRFQNFRLQKNFSRKHEFLLISLFAVFLRF